MDASRRFYIVTLVSALAPLGLCLRRQDDGGLGGGSLDGGGCCKFGNACGNCGHDHSGWCHQSAANCGKCSGSFDWGAPAPQCGGGGGGGSNGGLGGNGLSGGGAISNAGYSLVWSDEFDGNRLDTSKWTYINKGDGFGNDELQYYTSRTDNVYVSGGTLKIRARKEQYKHLRYTSGKLESKRAWTYGKFTMRARFDRCMGKGTWPAFWMMPRSSKYGWWPKSGEIDIFEFVGADPGSVHGGIHCEAYNHKKNNTKGGHSACNVRDWHTYGIEWREDRILFAVDNHVTRVYPKESSDWRVWPFAMDFFLILNNAVGGSWGGYKGMDERAFEGEGQIMEVDWVRVEQKNARGANPTPRPPFSWPTPNPPKQPAPSPTPWSGSRGGCCKFGTSCGDCGNDKTGWCHKSSTNCAKCAGRFDRSAPAPQCGGSAPGPTPAWRPSPVPQPTPWSGSRGGCCKFGTSCGDCGNDQSGWCHESSTNCAKCTGRFDASAPAPKCHGFGHFQAPSDSAPPAEAPSTPTSGVKRSSSDKPDEKDDEKLSVFGRFWAFVKGIFGK